MPVCRGLCLVFVVVVARGSAADKAPFRVLYSNDTTNILTCASPYHKRGETWRPEMLRATVDEVAGSGVEVHLIQLSSGQVPWYQSRIYPTAHLAYARGLDGVSTFNFVYYREHGVGERGPFNEPPFGIFKHLGDRAWLARQPQHYFLTASNWVKRGVLPKRMRSGESASFELDMAPPAGAWRRGGRLRVQAKADLGQSRWKAVLNGMELQEAADRSEPYENPYPPLLGSPAEHRAWLVPPAALTDGMNKVTVSLLSGQKEATLVFLDLALQ